MNNVKESVEQFQVLKELVKQFQDLIDERDFIVDFGEYNERCTEIDDQLIPEIIKKIPSGMMNKFNELVNQKS